MLRWLVLLFPTFLFSASLSDRLEKAEVGDFIVTEQNRTYSLLVVHAKNEKLVTLEEISIPSNRRPRTSMHWRDWVKNKAPAHTSWTIFEIDIATMQITEFYSITRGCWLSIGGDESFLTKLLSLSLSVPDTKNLKKRSGDKLWIPPHYVDGNQKKLSDVEVKRAVWPNDDSPLSGKELNVYFDPENQEFPFPFWIETAEGTKGGFKIREIDSGKGLVTPTSELPRRLPDFVGSTHLCSDGIRFSMQIPTYYKNFSIFAIDHTDHQKSPIAMPFVSTNKGKELTEIFIPQENSEKYLLPGHLYSWVFITETPTKTSLESVEQIFWR